MTPVQQPPLSTSRVKSPPPPRCPFARRPLRGFRVEGACVPWVELAHLGVPYPVFGLVFGTLVIPPLSIPIPREGMCPALGSAPSPPQKAWPHRPVGPPYKLPIQGAGPRGRGGWPLVWWLCLW